VTIESVKSARAANEQAVIDVMALAFGTDPVARWFYPNPQDYLDHFLRLALAIGRKAFANGRLTTSKGLLLRQSGCRPG
jgi:hypothetical protein